MAKKKKRSGLPFWFWLTSSAIGGLAFYSHFLVNHNLPMDAAIDAPRKEFFGKNSTFLSYYQHENTVGRPLVLLHGIHTAASSYEMRPFFAYYRGERPVYALDLPGFGFSERSQRDYSPSLYVAAIIDFLEGVVKEPADIIAQSLSGEFVALAAKERPDLFHSISLISPTGMADESVNLQEAELIQWLNNPVWAQPLYDLLCSKIALRFFLKQYFVNELDEALLDYAYDTSHQKGARHAPLSYIAGKLFTWNIVEIGYNPLTIPCLVLFDEDPNTNFHRLPEILSKNEACRARKIPKTRGLPQWEGMNLVAEALDKFWEGKA